MATVLTAPWWLPNVPWLKQRLEARLEARTGLECRLGRIVPIGWDGRVHLHGVRWRRPGREVPLLDLPHLAARIRWSSLVAGRLEIIQLDVEGGHLDWSPPPARTQASPPAEAEPGDEPPADAEGLAATETSAPLPDPGGKSAESAATGLLGSEPLVAAAEVPGPTAVQSLPEHDTPADPPGAATPPLTAPAPSPPPPSQPEQPTREPVANSAHGTRRWHLEQVRLSGLQLRWTRGEGTAEPEVASASLDADLPFGDTSPARPLGGYLRFSRVQLAGRTWPASIEMPVTWNGRSLQTREAPVSAPGGTVVLSWEMIPSAPGAPLTGEASFHGLKLDEASRWLAPSSAPAAGQAEGIVRFAVPARRPGRLRSVGQGRLTGLVLPMAAWLEQAGMPGLAARWPAPQWTTRGAAVQFSSKGPAIALEDATLSADELTVRALGTATAGGGPSLAVRAYVAPGGADLLTRLSAPWPPNRQLHPQPLPDSPWAYFDLGIQGSWSAPEFVLWDQAWRLPDLRSEIRRLQGPPPPS